MKLKASALAIALILTGCNNNGHTETQDPIPQNETNPSNKAPQTVEVAKVNIKSWSKTPGEVQLVEPDKCDVNTIVAPTDYYFTDENSVFHEPQGACGKLDRKFEQFDDFLSDYNENDYLNDLNQVPGKSIDELQRLMDEGKLTSVHLLKFYLYRAGKYDINGLNSIIEFNPDVVSQAKRADNQRKHKGRPANQPLFGLFVGLKDNIATDDRMHTATGSAAMLKWDPDHDASVVTQLRDAGAIILGKLNQGEWANFTDSKLPNGYSNNGGQTHNPHGLLTTCGSSAGTGVAVASDLVTIGLGSETSGSVICPAQKNGVYGIKSTIGLMSRENVIPLDEEQDSLGVMAKNIEDLAYSYTATTKIDPKDPRSAEWKQASGRNYSHYLSKTYRRSVTVGLPKTLKWNLDNSYEWIISPSYQELSNELEAGGVNVKFVEPLDTNRLRDEGYSFHEVIVCGFKYSVDNFLISQGDTVPFKNLNEIAAFNAEKPAQRMAYGQRYIEESPRSPYSPEECATRHQYRRDLMRKRIDDFLTANEIDVYAVKDRSMNVMDGVYSPAGYPAITVPYGLNSLHNPTAVIMTGTGMSEPDLFAAAKALSVGANQDNHGFVSPDLDEWKNYYPDAGY